MYFLFDLADSLLSCVSLADERHFYYFEGDSIFFSLVFASLFCFILLSTFCLTFSSLVFPSLFCFLFLCTFCLTFSSLFFASLFCFIFLSAFCSSQPLYASTFYFPLAFFSFLCAITTLCFSVLLFSAATAVVCLLFAFFFNLLSFSWFVLLQSASLWLSDSILFPPPASLLVLFL